MSKQQTNPKLNEIPVFDEETKGVNAIIETPKGGRNKYKYDEKLNIFRMSKFLPAGAVFPYDFGFIPSTIGEDGDPLDILVLMDEPAYTGCLVPVRMIGVIEAEQTEEGETERNDRLIAVASISHIYNNISSIDELSDNILTEIEHFFISYNQITGKEFKPIGRFGPERANELIATGEKLFQSKQRKPTPKQQAAGR